MGMVRGVGFGMGSEALAGDWGDRRHGFLSIQNILRGVWGHTGAEGD